jgi:hypothetical protein
MIQPVIGCPFCGAEYEVPVYVTPKGTRYYREAEAAEIADRHIASHANDLVHEISEFLNA